MTIHSVCCVCRLGGAGGQSAWLQRCWHSVLGQAQRGWSSGQALFIHGLWRFGLTLYFSLKMLCG